MKTCQLEVLMPLPNTCEGTMRLLKVVQTDGMANWGSQKSLLKFSKIDIDSFFCKVEYKLVENYLSQLMEFWFSKKWQKFVQMPRWKLKHEQNESHWWQGHQQIILLCVWKTFRAIAWMDYVDGWSRWGVTLVRDFLWTWWRQSMKCWRLPVGFNLFGASLVARLSIFWWARHYGRVQEWGGLMSKALWTCGGMRWMDDAWVAFYFLITLKGKNW